MADERHTIEILARHLINAARPLIEAGSSLGAFKRLMARLGFEATVIEDACRGIDTDGSLARAWSEMEAAGVTRAQLGYAG